MNRLRRELAPISDATWSLLDEGARQALVPSLGARRLVEVHGPHGWGHAATSLGRVRLLAVEPAAGVKAHRRVVAPLVELRAEFSLDLAGLEDAERGRDDLDLSPLDGAARQLAIAENLVVLQGYDQAEITGIAQASAHEPMSLGGDHDAWPRQVARAVATLRAAGVGGPYALAISPEGYTGIVETTEHGGVLLFEHLRQVLGGQIVWAPGIEGAVVVSARGGDYHLELGADVSLGYARHDQTTVHLYLEESLSFRVTTPEAAVALRL